jgi:antitoxin PrlF
MGFESSITSKGQTTIPAEIREQLGLQTGDRIAFIKMEQGYLIIPRNRPVESIFGSLAEFAIPGTTIDDYDRSVGEGISHHVEGPIGAAKRPGS